MFQRQLKMALKIGNVFINEDDLIPVIVKARTEIDTYVKFIYLFIYLFILYLKLTIIKTDTNRVYY